MVMMHEETWQQEEEAWDVLITAELKEWVKTVLEGKCGTTTRGGSRRKGPRKW